MGVMWTAEYAEYIFVHMYAFILFMYILQFVSI